MHPNIKIQEMHPKHQLTNTHNMTIEKNTPLISLVRCVSISTLWEVLESGEVTIAVTDASEYGMFGVVPHGTLIFAVPKSVNLI